MRGVRGGDEQARSLHALWVEPLPAGVQVRAPALEGLVVTVPAGEGFGEDELRERLDALAREKAARRALGAGERVARGDEVRVDVVGRIRGRAVPVAAESDFRAAVTPDPQLPGLWEGVATSPVGSQLEVHLVLPADYPEVGLRGSGAVFDVHLKQAWRLTMPDLARVEGLAALGRGRTLEEVMGSIAAELAEEAAARQRVEAQRRVLEALRARAQVTVPAALVEAALVRRWEEGLGGALGRLAVPAEERARALAEWRADPERRAETERLLGREWVLRAVAERERVVASAERKAALLAQVAAASGVGAEQLRASFAARPELAARLDALARRSAAIEHVMARAEVRSAGR